MADADDGRPVEFHTPLQEGSAAMYELYTSLREAGFTVQEALELTARMTKV